MKKVTSKPKRRQEEGIICRSIQFIETITECWDANARLSAECSAVIYL